MNRLIIIGNGFDLAHGIKTSYHDFILDYLKLSCLKAKEDGLKNDNDNHYQLFYFNDELVEIRIGTRYNIVHLTEKLSQINTVNEFIEFGKLYDIKLKYHFNLLKIGVNKLLEYNWVDFEIDYFEELIDLKNRKPSVNGKSIENEEIVKLNKCFDILKDKLLEYLSRQQNKFNNSGGFKTLMQQLVSFGYVQSY